LGAVVLADSEVVFIAWFTDWSDAAGFDEPQDDSTDEHERADGGRDEMVLGGLDVEAKEINRLPRSCETQAGIGEHNDAKRDEQDCDDGFHKLDE